MPNTKISALPSASALTSNDIFPIVNYETLETQATNASQISTYVKSDIVDDAITVNSLISTTTIAGGSLSTTTSIVAGTSLSSATQNTTRANFSSLTGSFLTSSFVNANFVTASSERLTGHLELAEIAVPANPASGFGRFYSKVDGHAYYRNAAGIEFDLTLSGSGGGTIDGSGAATRITTWSDADTLTSNGNLTWDTNAVNVTGTINVSNVLSVGSTISASNLSIVKDHDTHTLIRATNINAGTSARATLLLTRVFSSSPGDANGGYITYFGQGFTTDGFNRSNWINLAGDGGGVSINGRSDDVVLVRGVNNNLSNERLRASTTEVVINHSQQSTVGFNVKGTNSHLISVTSSTDMVGIRIQPTEHMHISGNVRIHGEIYGYSTKFLQLTGNYVLTNEENGKTLLINYGNQLTASITVPILTGGYGVTFVQQGSGTIRLDPGAGVSIFNRQNYTRSAGVYAVMSLVHISGGIFVSTGDMQ